MNILRNTSPTAAFYKLFSSFILCMTLNACGFSSDDNNLNEGTVDLPNDATEAPSNAQNIDVSQVKTLKKSTSERVGALSAGISDIIETGTLNSTGEFTHPQAAQEFTGNITAAFEVADEQGIARVFLAFAQSDLELPICKESCGNNFSSVVSGINPAVFGLSSGEQILQVWVEDNQGNLDRVDTVNVNWQSKAISGVNASYDEDTETVNVSWNALEGILRYNVYLATDAALKGQNVLELEGGDTRLALTSTSASFENKAADNYFIVITGVDGTGESAFSEQIVLINNLNQVPTADNLSFTTLEDQPLTGNLLTAQQNDYETLILNIEAVSAPSLGSLVLSETGAFTYTPNANVTGTDQFSYELSNEAGLSAQGIVEITITAVNDAPVALADNYTLNADASSLTITAPGLLANDSDIDGDNLSVVAEPVIAPTLGELSLSSDGSFVYTPSERFVNFDTFTYQISDAAGETSDAIVTITTDDFNGQIPIAKNGEYSVNEDSFLEIASDEGLFTLVSDGDNDLDDLTLSIVTEPQNGALLLSTDGSFNYTPQPNFSGSDSLVYQVLDPAGNKASATVSINVTPKNDAPIANDNYYILSANSLLTLSNNQGLFGNDSDIDGDSLKIATINGNQVNFDPNQTIATLSGSIQIYELGGFTYTPNENFEGTDSFTYQVTDGTLLSTSALVVLSVKNGVLETDNLTQLIIIDDLQNNDIDLTIIDANFSAEHGALSIENNQLVYTPSIEFGGTDLVTINYSYTTDEGQYNTHLEYIVNITKIDTEPLLVAESSLVVYENQVGATGFLATAVDVEGDDYTITWSDELGILTDHFINSSNSSDTLDIEIIKAFDFEELNNNFSANDLDESSDNNEFQLQFTVTATQDNNEEMHTNQIVKLTILDAEDAPEFTSESTFSVAENQQEGSLLFTVSAVDPDGQVISYDFDDAPNLFSINSDTGAVTLNSSSLDHETTPSYSFNIIATDSSGDSSTQIITLNIGDIDEAPEFLSNNTFFVSENTNVNSALFKVTAIDPERQNVNYSIQQGSNKFSIDSFNGIVTLNSEQLDYEDSDSYVLIVNAADSDGNSATQSIVINITNINEAPVFASGSIYTAPENTTVGSTLLTVGANDPESQTVTYSLSNDFNLFDINPSTGSITLSSAELDFETITSYILNVRATDILNKSSTKNITLNITDIDEAPSLLLNGSLSFDESQTGNTGYIVTAHDPEGDSYTITFTDNDELLTAYLSDIDSSTDTIEFSITSPVDYEMFNSMFAGLDADGDANNSVFEYHLTVKATQVDDPSLFEDYTLIVYIHDVVENTELYLDTNFANAGIASFSTYSDISSNDYLIDAVIDDSNNRFILVKSNDSYNFKDTYYVAKISQDGSFDLSFGINGRKQLAPSALNDGNIDDTNYTSLSGFTLKKLKISQPTDKVYLLGSQILSTGDTTETPIIVRLNSDGSLDNTFSSDGKYEVSVTTNDHSEAIDLLAIDNGTDYDLFLASNSTEDSSVTPASFKLIRMDTSGVEVESNSYNLSSSTTDYEYIKGMVANSNDDIFVFGDVENSSEAYDLLVAKLDKGNISSATVTSAQTGADLGVTTSGTTEMYTTIYIQSASDQLLVAGSITNSSELDAIIAKIDLSSFALDTSFNTNGYYTAGYIAGVNERVTGLAVDSNDNITFVTQTGYFSGQIQLIPSQLDTSGVVTTLGVSLAAEELTNTLGAGITTTSNIQARILHESGDDNLYVFSNFEKTNENSSTEIEIYYEKVDVNALPPDLAEKSNRIDYEFLTYDSSQVHDAIVHSSGKVLTSTDRYSDFNNYDYGYTLTAHDENSGEWLQTFSDSQYPGYIHQDSDSVNNLYLEALKFVELSDGSIIYLQLEEESSSSTTSLIVHKYDSNGNVVSGFPVSNTLAMQVSINEVIYNEMVEKVAIIGTSNVEIGDAYALMFSPSNGSVDYEFAPTQLFGVDATFGDPYANTLTAGIIRDDGTLIAIGNADTDTVSNTFMLKLSTSGLTDSSFGTVTSSGDYALTVTSEVEPIKLAELSDNSLVLLGYHTSDFEFGLYKFDVSGDSYVLNSNYNSDINYDYMPIDASTMISNINDTSYDNEVKDMVVDDSDRITFAGSLYVYARGDYGFIARFNGADGSVDTTLGNQTYPGYWMPAGVEDCQNQTSNTYIDVCDITSFEQLNVTSDGAIILHGIASAPDNYQHTVILKFIESQNDTAPASYSLIGDVIGGA